MRAEQIKSLSEYLNISFKSLLKQALRSAGNSPRFFLYLLRYIAAQQHAARLRKKREAHGHTVPLFLIASVTNDCNLNCTGCYHHANKKTMQNKELLSAVEWRNVFSEAEKIGCAAILLAGGEPLLRKEILNEAGLFPLMLFPVFTNGTLFDKDAIMLFKKNNNLIPFLSIEGSEILTNERRGNGVYSQLEKLMQLLHKEKIFFGASITITKENYESFADGSMLQSLKNLGCNAAVFVEYIPVEKNKVYELSKTERTEFKNIMEYLRKKYNDMLLLAFPADEESCGGCLAAGRGFFHINAFGGGEPCPFSPYSSQNVRTSSLEEITDSDFFRKLRENDFLQKEHLGPCHLVNYAQDVQTIADGVQAEVGGRHSA